MKARAMRRPVELHVSFESHRRRDPAHKANALRPFKPKVDELNLLGRVPDMPAGHPKVM